MTDQDNLRDRIAKVAPAENERLQQVEPQSALPSEMRRLRPWMQ